MIKKISWSALLAGMFIDIGMAVLQILVVFWIYATTRSMFLLYSWALVTELLVAVFVGYVIGKVAKEEPFLNECPGLLYRHAGFYESVYLAAP